jgi:putative NADH-flavin reductase
MNLLIFGATGRTGRHLTKLALADGHRVTAFVRDKKKMARPHAYLKIFEGNATHRSDIFRAFQVARPDAVLSALSTDKGTVLTDSMPLIIEAMQATGVLRILTIGTAGILNSRVEPGKYRYESSESPRSLTRASDEHRRAYEMLAASDLDWTVVCPTHLIDAPAQGSYRVERDYLPNGGQNISVPDTAEFTYRQLTCDEFIRARVGIAY